MIRRLFVVAALAFFVGCLLPKPSVPGPAPTPAPTPSPDPSPICPSDGATCGCFFRPPGQDWQQLPPCPEPPPLPPPTGCVLGAPGNLLGTLPQPVIDPQGHTLGWAVNDAMSRLTGCSVGSRCIITARPQVWQGYVESELRKQGLCSGQHAADTDEIAGSVGAAKPMFGYHIYSGDGWDDPTKTGTVVWSPGADRPAWEPAGVTTPPPTQPPPTAGDCPAQPCPIRTWTVETLPDGWGQDQIGKPAYEVKAHVHTMGNGDSTAVVIRQEPFCRAIGMSPYADGQPRASCPVRPDGHSERVAVENWLLFGGYIRDSRNGQDCTPHNNDNPAAFLWGTGNCRSCNVPKTACSEWN